MPKPYLRDLRAAAGELQSQVGNWVVAGVETTAPWPTVEQVVPYQGMDFILRPSTQDRAPTVCLDAQAHGMTSGQARDAILRFGSAMAWSGDWRFEVTMWVGGSHPFGIGRMVGNVVQDFFDVDELGAIPDEDTATALAFFREGITAHSPFYGFLNLYKVIAFIHRNNGDGKVRGKWIADALPRLTEEKAVRRLSELQKDGDDAADYLWKEGRNAIAHSEKGTFVNPDRIGDQERIERDLPLMRALARLAIEEHFGVHHRLSKKAARPSKISGFRTLFGDDVIAKTLAGIDLSGLNIALPDSLTALVRHGNDIHAFRGLRIAGLKQVKGGIGMWMLNADETLQLTVLINLVDECLNMNPSDIECLMNQKSRSSIEQALLAHHFSWKYLGNGSVEIWSEDDDTLLGKTEPYYPLNGWSNPDWHEKCVEELTALIDGATEP
jgi:hypothetical protein